MRNALSLVPRTAQQMVAATIRTVYAQPDAAGATSSGARVADGFRWRYPKLAELMDEAEEDVLSLRELSYVSTGSRYGPTTRWSG